MCFHRILILVLLSVLLSGTSMAQNVSFDSGTNWAVYDADPATGPTNYLGDAQEVCLYPALPGCPPSALSYQATGTGWTADLSSIPNAWWIWAPGITLATQPAEYAEFFFARQFQLGVPSNGTITIAADDMIEVFVNGTSAGTRGSTTDVGLAGQSQSSVGVLDLTPFLVTGTNWITIRGQNGDPSFPGCTSPCTYAEHPAGVVFGGVLESSPAVPSSSVPTSLVLGTLLAVFGIRAMMTERPTRAQR